MKYWISLLILSLSFSFCTQVRTEQKGPYTVSLLAAGVYHIEDANDSNPAGVHLDKDGKMAGMNNCSDMYLVVGKGKALLVDLSNAIKWDTTATESLRSVVYERVGKKELYITITHRHGDHYGMLPAFYSDAKARFWIPEAEFNGLDIFPKERTTYFKENESFDLGGGFVMNTMEVPGHTAHSTLFFLKDKNIAFTGDAIGSGSGVWIFNYDSFLAYVNGIGNLIKYLEAPANNIDKEKLVIYGGHAWQRGKMDKLSAQYVYDMQTLIERIGSGSAETEPMSSFISYLDTNFKLGTATISWNMEDAARYAEAQKTK
jgi:glyoxylase-like metal-dependent hydrolase (beta-lactamase superfamily II)